jgi:hypothetical protein
MLCTICTKGSPLRSPLARRKVRRRRASAVDVNIATKPTHKFQDSGPAAEMTNLEQMSDIGPPSFSRASAHVGSFCRFTHVYSEQRADHGRECDIMT